MVLRAAARSTPALQPGVGLPRSRKRPLATGGRDLSPPVPATRCPDLQALADRCVVELDEFRRPAGAPEFARRRASGLSPRQDALLVRWGYPYLFDEWRFHLTLTGRIACEKERATVAAVLRQRFAAVTEQPLAVRDLCIFRQPAPGRPFTVLARFRLGGGRRVRTATWQSP